MTADQKQRLAAHVAWHKPRRFNGDTLCFLTEGEIISFTNCEYTAQNAEHERLRVGELCSGMHLRTSLRVQRYDNPPKLH